MLGVAVSLGLRGALQLGRARLYADVAGTYIQMAIDDTGMDGTLTGLIVSNTGVHGAIGIDIPVHRHIAVGPYAAMVIGGGPGDHSHTWINTGIAATMRL